MFRTITEPSLLLQSKNHVHSGRFRSSPERHSRFCASPATRPLFEDMFIVANRTITATKAKKAKQRKKVGDKGKLNGETVNANGTKNLAEMDDDVREDDGIETSIVSEKGMHSRTHLISSQNGIPPLLSSATSITVDSRTNVNESAPEASRAES